jgi:hypothetical protein
MSPLSQGYESTRMVPECYSASQTSQHSISHRIPGTQSNPSTYLSSTQPAPPKRMDPLPSLPHSPSSLPSPSRALFYPACTRISMVGLSGLIAMRKFGHRPNNLRYAGLKSWLDYTNSLYSEKYHGFSSAICLPFPSQDTDAEK